MSVSIFRVVPADPAYVPSVAAQRAAMERLRACSHPDVEIEARETEHVEFLDPGECFEGVFCPACHEELHDPWWGSAMRTAYAAHFVELSVVTPCCRTSSTLNDLDYRWPAAFARFRIEARDWQGTLDGRVNGGLLSKSDLESIGQAMGCRVRQVLARY